MSKIIQETKTEKLNEMLNDNNNSIKIKNKIAEELFFRLNGWRLTEIINWVAASKFRSKIKNYKEKIKMTKLKQIVIGRQELAEALINKFFKEEIKWPIENY